MGLTTLNQALICTPIPNLMGVIRSESMISQAFQACYSIEGCLSDRCILASERIGYMIENIHQLNLTLKRITFTTSRASEMKARAKEALSINLHSEKYIRILQMLETQLKRNRKGNSPFYHSPSHLSSMTPPCGHATFLSSIPPKHDHVILLYLHTSLLPIISWTPNQLPSTLNTV